MLCYLGPDSGIWDPVADLQYSYAGTGRWVWSKNHPVLHSCPRWTYMMVKTIGSILHIHPWIRKDQTRNRNRINRSNGSLLRFPFVPSLPVFLFHLFFSILPIPSVSYLCTEYIRYFFFISFIFIHACITWLINLITAAPSLFFFSISYIQR